MNPQKERHFDEDNVVRSGEGRGDTFSSIVERRLTRRTALKLGALGGILLSGGGALAKMSRGKNGSPTGLDFEAIPPSTSDTLAIAKNYFVYPVAKWGDPMFTGMSEYAAGAMTAEKQSRSVGYNCDFVGFFPLPRWHDESENGLLGINNEYVNPELMFPIEHEREVTKSQVETCIEAMGFTVLEIEKKENRWTMVKDSKYNKRWTASSELRLSGPAAGDERLKTARHPKGDHCIGTMSNCSAGKTPWGTVLSGEENFQACYGNAEHYSNPKDKRSAQRYGLGMKKSENGWEAHLERFDTAKNPNEPYTFGWVVEIDPYDPNWVPVKRTALGRFRHEAATTHVTKNRKIVMYSGDDSRFEYVYKFVCRDSFEAGKRDYMDNGILYVAVFHEDGTGEWKPLVHGVGPLTSENGLDSQADVVIDARIAADLVGATKMDRPEDIEVNPVNDKVYVVCTNNTERGKEGKEGTTASNPRADNKHGHIVEITEENDDHTSTRFTWELFLVCGDPEDESTYYAGFPKENLSPISCPDNICFDAQGNLWIATDGMEKTMKLRDGFFAVATDGPERGKLKQLFASVPGSEVCGPEFTPDGRTAFLAIQHPGEGSSFASPSTKWPDGSGVPRPTVVAIQARNNSVIGGKGE